ncbi:hypothetical protein DZC73_27725 [Albitalea terrae]|uniref:Uncharacterized protein n=1 Tax=Piscinibacter terrae TaxID=2496871 RepID=A0A3N7IS52_9BURK|nr:hypothetical protein DZC73_27725 [Albitalea terrae]
MKRHLAFALLLALSSGVFAESNCQAHSKATGSFKQAVGRVSKLPELQEWKARHKFPVAYGFGDDKQEFVSGICRWVVPVFADRPERLEAWNTFYVSAASRTIYVMNQVTGEPQTIAEWRNERRSTQRHNAP